MSLKTLMLEFGIVGSLGRAVRGMEVEKWRDRGVSLVDEARCRETMLRRENMVDFWSMDLELMDGVEESCKGLFPVQGPYLGIYEGVIAVMAFTV